MFTFVLYPYVYLLARTAFLERAAALIEAARLAGPRPLAAFWRVDAAAGAAGDRRRRALALMETLADFGTVVLFRREDVHHRHLSRLVVAGRPHRGRAARRRAARSSCWCCSR